MTFTTTAVIFKTSTATTTKQTVMKNYFPSPQLMNEQVAVGCIDAGRTMGKKNCQQMQAFIQTFIHLFLLFNFPQENVSIEVIQYSKRSPRRELVIELEEKSSE